MKTRLQLVRRVFCREGFNRAIGVQMAMWNMQVVANVHNKCYQWSKMGPMPLATMRQTSAQTLFYWMHIYEPFYGATLGTLSARATLHVCGQWVEVSILNRSVIGVVWQTQASLPSTHIAQMFSLLGQKLAHCLHLRLPSSAFFALILYCSLLDWCVMFAARLATLELFYSFTTCLDDCLTSF